MVEQDDVPREIRYRLDGSGDVRGRRRRWWLGALLAAAFDIVNLLRMALGWAACNSVPDLL
ncbi:MAG TPA: hypothetical protein VGG15_04565 [Terriglobales bacterium]|jgi:hypothetical protein